MARKGAICLWTWLGVVLFVSAFLIGYSFDTLPPNTMAFLFDRNTMKLHENRVYNNYPGGSGRFYTGLGRYFDYKFSRRHQVVRFDTTSDAADGPIQGLTNEGATVSMSISFIYTLPTTAPELKQFLTRFGGKHGSFINNFVRSAARDVMGDVSVFDLFQNRSDIKYRLTNEVRSTLFKYNCSLNSVQVLNIDIPIQLARAIQDTTVTEQAILKQQFYQNAQRVAAETNRLTSELQSLITIRNANASATAAIYVAKAKADAKVYSVSQEAAAYANVSATLNMNTTQLLALVWLDAIAASNATSTTLGVSASAAADV